MRNRTRAGLFGFVGANQSRYLRGELNIMVTTHAERTSHAESVATATPLSEMAAALAIIVLAILALVGVVPAVMLSIATIVAGAAILLQGAELAAEYRRFLIHPGAGAEPGMFGGGITLDFMAGGTGIVLGILSLFSHPGALIPAALIVFGATLLLGGAVASRRTAVEAFAGDDGGWRIIAEQLGAMASGAQVLIGVGVIVLGILALMPAEPLVLTSVGLLAVGAGALMTSAASSGAALAHPATGV
jgi:hypothetical protein